MASKKKVKQKKNVEEWSQKRLDSMVKGTKKAAEFWVKKAKAKRGKKLQPV